MRYHYKIPADTRQIAGETYKCNHEVYSRGTLFKKDYIGLVVIQQRWNPNKRISWWSEIDPWLASELFMSASFNDLFEKFAGEPINGIYPTITIRQAMAFLKIKPLKREKWETLFDRKPI